MSVRGFALRAAATLVLLIPAACATAPREPARPGLPSIPSHAIIPQRPTVQPAPPPAPIVSPAALPGWASEDHLAALKAYRAGCRAANEPAAARTCQAAHALAAPDAAAARAFFEHEFTVETVGENGLLTGYFAPEYEARMAPDEIFSAPVRPRPPELKRGPDGRFEPWLERAEIERSEGPALAFMRPEDLFFMQIQGSGYLDFPDGRRLRAAYAADNGRPFVGIALTLTRSGALPAGATSGERIRAWLAEHRGPEAQAVTDTDPRYIFFALGEDDGGQPAGAAGVPLPPGRSGAVDPRFHAWGDLLWIASDGGDLDGARPGYHRLVLALDRGGAIQGPARLDLYLGRGPQAGLEAGRIKQPLRLYRLKPRD